MTSPSITVLVVDDEPLARQRLTLMLSEHVDVEIVGEAATVADAARLVRALRPDCVFLDVSMPGGSGFRLFDTLPTGSRPFVVFVTAHAEHALKAFDVSAVDYLLKPYDDERLQQALEKVRRARAAQGTDALRDEIRAIALALRHASGASGHDASLPDAPGAHSRPVRFSVTIGKRTVLVPVAEIDWIEADRNYVWLNWGAQRLLHRCGIGQIVELLDASVFARVSRSAIVRIDRVKELRTLSNGEMVAVLRSGAEVPVGGRYRDVLG